MTLEEFRKNEILSTALAQLLRTNEALRTALAILDEGAPGNAGINSLNFAQEHQATIQLGFDRGYNFYPRLLRLLATPLPKSEPLEPTYENPVEEEEPAPVT